MLLSFAGTSMLSAFFCMCFRHWSLRLVVARRYMSWTCPSESLGCSSDGHEPTADGGCFLTLVFVVLLGVWLEAGDAVSLFLILDTLGGHCPSWRHYETASIVAMLYFQGRYFLILLQSYVAADVILPWQVLWHVQWFVGFSSFFSLSLQDFTWKNE